MDEEDRKTKGKSYYHVCFEHFAPADRIYENGVLVGVRPGAVPINIAGSRLVYEKVGEVFPRYVIVERSELQDLFKFCPHCGTPINRTLDFNINASNITYHWNCTKCNGRQQWSAQQPFDSSAGKRQTLCNLSLVSASILSPISYNVSHFN